MSKKTKLEEAMRKLADEQVKYLTKMPTRENIGIFDWELDLAQNEDFALWEMEIYPSWW